MAAEAETNVLMASGNQTGAADAYMRSSAFYEMAAWPYYRAKALTYFSDAITEKKPEESRKLLPQAAEIFKKLRAMGDLEKAQRKLSEISN